MPERAETHLAATLTEKPFSHSLCLPNTNLQTEGAIEIAKCLANHQDTESANVKC